MKPSFHFPVSGKTHTQKYTHTRAQDDMHVHVSGDELCLSWFAAALPPSTSHDVCPNLQFLQSCMLISNLWFPWKPGC